MGNMNFFCLWKDQSGTLELVTSQLDATILPGVTRDSILQLTRGWGEFAVKERPILVEELVEALQQNRVVEVFGSGTGCLVCPVGKIWLRGQDYPVPLALGNSGVLAERLREALLSIQHGEEESPWTQLVCDSSSKV